jgi:hypothetical protein
MILRFHIEYELSIKCPCKFMLPNPTECISLLPFETDGTFEMSVISDTDVNNLIDVSIRSPKSSVFTALCISSEPKLHETS